MATRIKTSCPQCGKSLKVDESLIGKNVRCPACRHRFLLSSLSFSGDGSRDPSMEAVHTIGDGDDGTAEQRAQQRQSEPSVGSIGRFEIKSALGGGGFGVVYRAFDPVLGREVALKVPKFGPDDAKRTQRFLIEAQAAAHLHHPNIVAVFESGQAGDKAFIASEYVAGKPLSVRSEEDPPSFQEAALWTRALADALGYAHDEGIIHRDIKPDNIMMAAKDRPQIMDFGLAKRTDEDSSMTGDGSILGTPAYMSPEQARGETDRVGPHSDQYSLGVVLYELLTGKRPFEGPPHSVVAQVAAQEPPAPRKLNVRIPVDLEAICQQTMEKEPSARYADMHEFAEDLTRWLAGRVTKARPIGAVERLRRWCKRNPTIAGLSLTVAVLVVAVALLSTIGYVRTRYVLKETEETLEQTKAELAAEKNIANTETAGRIVTQRNLAISHFDRGRSLCEQGEVGFGLLWLARSLETLPPGSDDLERVIRTNLAAWRKRLRAVPLPIFHSTTVRSVRFSPDGRKILTGSHDGTARLWNADTIEPIGTPMQHQNQVREAVFSPDSSMVLTGSLDNTARFWDAATGKPLGQPLQHPAHVEGVSFSPDGKKFATASWPDDRISIWDTATRQLIVEPIAHQGAVVRAKFSPDGTTLVTGVGGGSDNAARLWDVAARKQIGQLLQHQGYVRTVAFSPDGKSVATGSDDATARIWDAATGAPISEPLKHEHTVWGVAYSPDGSTLATGGRDKTVRLWNAGTGDPLGKPLTLNQSVNAVTFSPDGESILVGCRNGSVRRWSLDIDAPTGKPLTHQLAIIEVALSPDGRSVFTGGGQHGVAGEARLWDRTTGNPIGPPISLPERVNTVAFRPDGQRVLTGTGTLRSNGVVKFWDPQTGQTVGPTLLHDRKILDAVFSPDGRTVLTGCQDGSARLWDAETGTLIGQPLVHRGPVACVAFSPDGSALVTGCADSSARIWNAETRQPIAVPLEHRERVRSVAVSPDGSLVATGSHDGTARLWNASTGAPAGRRLWHPTRVAAVGFSPDGKTLLTADNGSGLDDISRLWDVATSEPLGPPLRRHGAYPVGFSTDGKDIFTIGEEEILRHDNLPVPVSGGKDRVTLWTQLLTGMELGKDRGIEPLDAKTWQERRRQLEALGGPPYPERRLR